MAEHTPNRIPEPVRPAWSISRASILAAGVVLLVYLGILYVIPKHVFWSPDEGGRFIELRSLEWDNGLTRVLPYPGRRLDPDLRFFPTPRVYPEYDAEGALRVPWPIWFPLLSRPFFNLFGANGIYVVPVFCGWLIVLICGFLTQRLGSLHTPAAMLIVGLASPVFFYSLTFWEHTLATSLVMLAVAVVVAVGGTPLSLLAALPLVLAACMLRLEMFAVVPALLLAVLVANRRAPGSGPSVLVPARWRRPLALACAVSIVGMVAAFVFTFPPWRWHFIHSPRATLEGMLFLTRIPGGLVDAVINSPRNGGPVLDRAWGYAGLAAVTAAAAGAFIRRPRLQAALLFPPFAFVLCLSAWIAFAEHQYRAVHGVVLIAPYILAGWYALLPAWQERRRLPLLMATLGVLYLLFGLAAIIVFYISSRGLESTLEWGQRYMLTVYPLFGVLAVLAVSEYWRSARSRLQRVVFAGFVVASVLLALQYQQRGLTMLYWNRELLAAWDNGLRNRAPVVTDMWWLPTGVADLFTSSEMFVARDRTALLEWIASARSQGVRAFTHAGLDQRVTRGPWPRGVRVRKRWTHRGLRMAEFELAPP